MSLQNRFSSHHHPAGPGIEVPSSWFINFRTRPARLPASIEIRVILVVMGLLFAGCGKAKAPAKPEAKSPAVAKKEASPEVPQRITLPAPVTQNKQAVAAAVADGPPAEKEKWQLSDVQQIYRPLDSRKPYDDVQLAKRGVIKVSTERLILYSDLPKKDLTGLPDLAEQLYPALEEYFGPLPPDRKQQPYQMTAFLMADAQKFLDAGLISENRVQPHEGWYRGNEFWWNLQPAPYYTRHLLLHEATHCFMHVMPAVDCPPWYVEGMAEHFGTHEIDAAGKVTFGVMPKSPEKYPGWERISVIQQEVREGRLLGVDQICAMTFNDFQKLPAYAWSWALCHFLNSHPRYQKPFQQLAKTIMDGGFQKQTIALFERDMPDMRDEWILFASQIQYGHDIVRSEVKFQSGKDLAVGSTSQDQPISAERGWQSSGVKLVAGRTYRVHASGRVTLATTSKPWISEPQGISIRYFSGQPLGRLLGCVRPDPPPSLQSKKAEAGSRDLLKIIPLGPQAEFVASSTGTLYLRANDAWNELADNSREYAVKIEALK
jgi:hypothetical protein